MMTNKLKKKKKKKEKKNQWWYLLLRLVESLSDGVMADAAKQNK